MANATRSKPVDSGAPVVGRFESCDAGRVRSTRSCGPDRAMVLRAVVFGTLMHGCFTIGLPYLLLRGSPSLTAQNCACGLCRGLGYVLIVLGAVLYTLSGWELLFVSKVSAVPLDPPSRLKIDGLYGRVRNPLLLGVVLILFGEGAFFRSFALLLYASLYWLVIHLFVVLKEEPDLKLVFGDSYKRYCSQVPRWLPRLSRLGTRLPSMLFH